MSSDKFNEKLLGDELEELKYLRSISPHNIYSNHARTGSRSPRLSSRSPRPPHAAEVPPPTITINTQPAHDYCPEIARWPAPPPNPALTKNISSSIHTQQPATTAATNVAAATASLSPIAMSARSPIRTSPYVSPHHSPIPRSPNEFAHYNFGADFDGSPSKLLSSMLKVVAASSPNSGMGLLESELRQKIQALEELVAEYERQKFNVMGTFSDYRERVAERERKLETEYSNKIIGLSEEVLGAKKDFETRMKSFQSLQEQYEREKEQALEKLRQEHQKEIQSLEKRFSETQLLNLEQKYMIEIQRLEEERKCLKTEKERLSESFEMKLRRAQSFYESELTSAKLLYTRELQALKEHEEALKDELAARQDEFCDRLTELQLQSKQSKDEMNNCKNEVAHLEQKLHLKMAEIQSISKELTKARSDATEALKKLSMVTANAEESRKEAAEKKADLERKIRQLNQADVTRNKLETTIRELRTEVKALKNRVELLEMERDNLQSQSENQSSLHDSQVHALEAMLESVTKEKETSVEHYEKLLEREREQAEEREYSVKKEFSNRLNELEEQYNSLREHIDQSDALGPDNIKLWEEIESLRTEKKTLEDEVAKLKKNESSHSRESLNNLLGAIAAVKGRLDRGGEESIRTELAGDLNEELIKEVPCGSLNTEGRELSTLVEKLEELERSLEEIIEEKNETRAKVEQLDEENRLLNEEISHHRSLRNGDSERGKDKELELERVLGAYKGKIVEMEERLRRTTEQNDTVLRNQMAQWEEQWEKERGEMVNEIFHLKKKLKAAEESRISSEFEEIFVNELNGRVSVAEEKAKRLARELDEKKEELERAEHDANEELNRREEEQKLALERKIGTLNREHEKTVELIREHEMELAEELDELRKEFAKTKVELERVRREERRQLEKTEDQTQTEEIQTETEEDRSGHRDAEELNHLREDLERMKQLANEKDELIRELQETLKQNARSGEETEKHKHCLGGRKENRSQSIAGTSEHLAMCQKVAASTRFPNLLVSHMDKSRCNKSSTGAGSGNLGIKAKDHHRFERHDTWSSGDGASSGLLDRRECSPYKYKFKIDSQQEQPSPSSSTSTYSLPRSSGLLSPSATESIGSGDLTRRLSPSRQLFFKSSFESKRPAWKF